MIASEWTEPRTDPEELNRLVREYHAGQVYLSKDIPEGVKLNVFMPLLFLDKRQRQVLTEHPPAMIVGSIKDALPRSVNGYPIFTTIRYLYPADWATFVDKFNRLTDATKAVLEA